MNLDTIFLAINWSSVGLKVAQLLLSLSILVILHEFGHYITAKWFKCRVEKFYLFFDPWFSLFKKKIGETVYGIGWLPLGGYVKIAGMVDESMDKEQLKLPPQPYEFRSKPAWQRLIIMIGGVTVNIILAFLIYAMILMVWGEKKVPVSSLKYGITFNDSIFYSLGFKNGDRILNVDGKTIDDYNKILKKLLVVDHKVLIERDGKEMELIMPQDLIGQLVEKRKKSDGPLISPRVPSLVTEVNDTSMVYKAGLRKGDYITAIDSIPAQYMDELRNIAATHKSTQVVLQVNRAGSNVSIPAKISNEGKIGFAGIAFVEQMDSLGILKYSVRKYGFFESLPAGVRRAGEELVFYIDQFKKILSPSTGAYKGVGGFKAMGSVFSGDTWDWEHFWTITAFFSIVLAFMNLLPIPALDGGHVLFTLIEMVTGRKPSDKFLEYAQIGGMIILLLLMLYANGNDWFGWGKGR
ncbi:MAG: RIP metalloprotease RseP [Chitinophagaceae bacterium]|nr:RIP metalloprotease RseP [Chitinophagaceae bacterium]MBP6987180.1 RIP metalloprotease RseP [Ferruginibacter sp.]MBK7346958.1 RIP metalloprotease RseP [Chitinophagaceae bacterium]MBK8773476.1 RIP metalloprotease RseP [Chitinophagaceae bacterium]MBP7718699.1 RIP metalloprotease RseP [Ferruginibacter sp.]